MTNTAIIEEVVTRTERYDRIRNSYDRWQRRFLILGALVDISFGSLLYFAPEKTTKTFHLIVPPDRLGMVWVQLVGMLLMAMSLIYIYGSLNPGKRLGIVIIGAVGRIWAVGFYLYCIYGIGAPKMFLVFVGLDGVLFLLHYWALGPDRGHRIKSAWTCANLSS